MNTQIGPTLLVADEPLTESLSKVLESILSFAQEQRKKDPAYQNLFCSFKDGGVAKAVFDAERAMSKIAMDLMDVLRQGGKSVDRDLFLVLMGLPLAMHLVRKDVERVDGNCCCTDKTRLLLKTFVHKHLGIDVEVVPFNMTETTRSS